MISAVQAVLCCGLSLCGLGDALLARCAGGLCAFQRPGDFEGSRSACRDQGGQMFSGDIGLLSDLVAGLGGPFWLQAERGDRPAGMCPSVSADAGLAWTTCRQQSGFLCQYPPGTFCAPLNATGDSRVSYSSYTGSEVVDSDTFPAGSTAVARRPGAEHPESKHMCVSGGWLGAPWSCEVLRGGCEHLCVSSPRHCVCPPGHLLQPNGFTCAVDPCAKCAQTCQRDPDDYACTCTEGYKLAPDKESCVNLNECELGGACTAEGQECLNTGGGFECTCIDGLDMVDGACVNVSICFQCEHDCDRIHGVFQCVCRRGFRVSTRDPTKCEQHCTERDCPARCDPNPARQGTEQCYCPQGYVADDTGDTVMCTDINECDVQVCDHMCENLFGSFICDCHPGFQLQGESRCVQDGKEEGGDDGSGGEAFTPAGESPASPQPAALPSYIQTGSVLGITVFLALCAVLLFFLTRHAVKRCGRFELSSFKHPDIDIYYLQQVSTETYKRLSLDRQIRHEPQRL